MNRKFYLCTPSLFDISLISADLKVLMKFINELIVLFYHFERVCVCVWMSLLPEDHQSMRISITTELMNQHRRTDLIPSIVSLPCYRLKRSFGFQFYYIVVVVADFWLLFYRSSTRLKHSLYIRHV